MYLYILQWSLRKFWTQTNDGIQKMPKFSDWQKILFVIDGQIKSVKEISVKGNHIQNLATKILFKISYSEAFIIGCSTQTNEDIYKIF